MDLPKAGFLDNKEKVRADDWMEIRSKVPDSKVRHLLGKMATEREHKYWESLVLQAQAQAKA